MRWDFSLFAGEGMPALGFDRAIDLVRGQGLQRAQWSSSWRRRCALTR
jgi:hypothetical protein